MGGSKGTHSLTSIVMITAKVLYIVCICFRIGQKIDIYKPIITAKQIWYMCRITILLLIFVIQSNFWSWYCIIPKILFFIKSNTIGFCLLCSYIYFVCYVVIYGLLPAAMSFYSEPSDKKDNGFPKWFIFS